MGYGQYFSSQINPFVPNAPFLYPLKTSENLRVFWCFDVFRVLEKGCIGNEWVNETVSPSLKISPAQFDLESECVCLCHVNMHWLKFLKYSILSEFCNSGLVLFFVLALKILSWIFTKWLLLLEIKNNIKTFSNFLLDWPNVFMVYRPWILCSSGSMFMPWLRS